MPAAEMHADEVDTDVALVGRLLASQFPDWAEATWARGRGWALSQALGALSYYTVETNPVLVREARRWLAEVLG